MIHARNSGVVSLSAEQIVNARFLGLLCDDVKHALYTKHLFYPVLTVGKLSHATLQIVSLYGYVVTPNIAEWVSTTGSKQSVINGYTITW